MPVRVVADRIAALMRPMGRCSPGSGRWIERLRSSH